MLTRSTLSQTAAALDLNRQVGELPRSGALAEKSAFNPEERDVQVHLDGADCGGGQEVRDKGDKDYNIVVLLSLILSVMR